MNIIFTDVKWAPGWVVVTLAPWAIFFLGHSGGMLEGPVNLLLLTRLGGSKCPATNHPQKLGKP